MRAKRAKKIAARETQKKILEKKIFKKKTYATKLFLGSRGGAKFNTTWVNPSEKTISLGENDPNSLNLSERSEMSLKGIINSTFFFSEREQFFWERGG